MNKFCQSCGMPMNKDPKGGGEEMDGTKNENYCSLCYMDGQFTSPEIDSAEKMQTFCIEKMKEQGTPKVVGWLFTRGIPKLERWRKSD